MEKINLKQTVHVYLKTGQCITFDCDEFTIEYDNKLHAMGYKFEGANKRMLWFDVDEICAAVVD